MIDNSNNKAPSDPSRNSSSDKTVAIELSDKQPKVAKTNAGSQTDKAADANVREQATMTETATKSSVLENIIGADSPGKDEILPDNNTELEAEVMPTGEESNLEKSANDTVRTDDEAHERQVHFDHNVEDRSIITPQSTRSNTPQSMRSMTPQSMRSITPQSVEYESSICRLSKLTYNGSELFLYPAEAFEIEKFAENFCKDYVPVQGPNIVLLPFSASIFRDEKEENISGRAYIGKTNETVPPTYILDKCSFKIVIENDSSITCRIAPTNLAVKNAMRKYFSTGAHYNYLKIDLAECLGITNATFFSYAIDIDFDIPILVLQHRSKIGVNKNDLQILD